MKREVTVVVFGQDCSPSPGLCTAEELAAIGQTFLAAAEHMAAGRIGRVEIMDQDDEGLPLLPLNSTPSANRTSSLA